MADDQQPIAPKKARVLHDHDGHKINSIVIGDDAVRGALEGWADPHPSAVKYAEKLARQARRAANPDADD